jgi:rhodanese-related sulfurtransferase
MNKTLKEIVTILLVSAGIGLIFNTINQEGVSLIADASRFKVDSTKIKAGDLSNFKNDPYDTTGKSMPLGNPQIDPKLGFVKPGNIGIVQAKQFYDINALFIDGRTREEYFAGHIKGAINYPYEEFKMTTPEQKVAITKKFNKNGIIVVYCGGGTCEVSIDLAYELGKLGFKSVNIFLGGWVDWVEAGYPTEKPNQK